MIGMLKFGLSVMGLILGLMTTAHAQQAASGASAVPVPLFRQLQALKASSGTSTGLDDGAPSAAEISRAQAKAQAAIEALNKQTQALTGQSSASAPSAGASDGTASQRGGVVIVGAPVPDRYPAAAAQQSAGLTADEEAAMKKLQEQNEKMKEAMKKVFEDVE